jgi:putative transposase
MLRSVAPGNRAARVARQRAAVERGDRRPRAFACFEDDFEACIAHLRLPVTHRRFIRTTNLLERLFVEERRRLKIIPDGFGEKPVLKLMFGALIRAGRWRGLRFIEFELRQIAAVRKELEPEYEASITPPARSSRAGLWARAGRPSSRPRPHHPAGA